MLLVPRQLRRTGMTGDVPYYGGRFTPVRRMRPHTPSTRTAGAAVFGEREPRPPAVGQP